MRISDWSSDVCSSDLRQTLRSILGIVIQGVAIAIGAGAPWAPTLDPLGAPALLQAAAVALLMATTVGLFVWAPRTTGRNWSIVARTLPDHRLRTPGPSPLVHPPTRSVPMRAKGWQY